MYKKNSLEKMKINGQYRLFEAIKMGGLEKTIQHVTVGSRPLFKSMVNKISTFRN